jgi:hypothetical protein
MKKVIYAETIKQMILSERDKLTEGKKGQIRCGLRRALRCLEKCPAADVIIVKRAKWKTAKSGKIICSECGNYPLYGRDGVQKDTPHCWYCGSFMWGEADEI